MNRKRPSLLQSILVYSALFLFSISCTRQKEQMTIDVDAYYALKDSFLGDDNICRLLLYIPKKQGVEHEAGKELTLYFNNNNGVLTFSHSSEEKKGENEYSLKAIVIGSFNDGQIAVAPSFSPVTIKKELVKSLRYTKNRTPVLTIKVKPSKDKFLELEDIQV